MEGNGGRGSAVTSDEIQADIADVLDLELGVIPIQSLGKVELTPRQAEKLLILAQLGKVARAAESMRITLGGKGKALAAAMALDE
jgi:hypothetical protein